VNSFVNALVLLALTKSLAKRFYIDRLIRLSDIWSRA